MAGEYSTVDAAKLKPALLDFIAGLVANDSMEEVLARILLPAVLPTDGPPSNAYGADGQIAFDGSEAVIYGPKADGVWPAGVSLVGPANPAGSGDMLRANNLSDLMNVGTARTNLGLGSAATKDSGTAAGNVLLLDSGGKVPAAVLDRATLKPTESLVVAVSDEVTALTQGTAKVTFRMPYAMTLTGVRGSLSTAQASGTLLTVDVNEGGASILSTKLTFDNNEKTTTTAATPPVISDTALADDAEITVDIDLVGNGTAKGLKVTLIGYRT